MENSNESESSGSKFMEGWGLMIIILTVVIVGLVVLKLVLDL